MIKQAYISNLTAAWPAVEQRRLLAKLPGWPAEFAVIEDVLDVRQRRSKDGATLWHRNSHILRTSTRRETERGVYAASVAVFAVSMEDMFKALTLAGKLGMTVHFLHEKVAIHPSSGAEALHEVAKRFSDARRELWTKGAGRVSGEKRSAEAVAKLEAIKARWPLPSADYPTKGLLDEADVSFNTAKLYLGNRGQVQRKHKVDLEANQKRAAARTKRKEAQNT